MPSIDDYAQNPGLKLNDVREFDPKRHQLLGIAEVVGAPAAAFDFTTPIGTPVPPGEDQGSSSSCTWQAFAYYFWQWTGIQLSRQDGYSRTRLPDGGGYLIDPFRAMMRDAKDGFNNTDGTGCFTREQHDDPKPQTEQNMVLKVNLPGQIRKTFNIRYWYVGYNDIEAVAAAIKNWKGCVFGVYYNRNMWQNGQHPDVVTPANAVTAHAIYGMDVARDRGQDAIVAMSSWTSWVPNHFIIKDYFLKGGVFSPIVMEVTELGEEVVTQAIRVQYGTALGFAKLIDGRHFVGELASDITDLTQLEDNYNISFKDAHGNWYAPEMVIPVLKRSRYRLNYKGALGFITIGDGRQLVGELASNKEDLVGLEDNYNIKYVQADGSFMAADILVAA